MANVYLIATDLHDTDKGMITRFDYQSEVKFAKDTLEQIALSYKEKGDTPVILSLGDLFHSGIKSPTIHTRESDWIKYLDEEVARVFMVMGNHDMHFLKDNPWLSLVKEIESPRAVYASKYPLRPYGRKNYIRIVDQLTDGNVTFHFNHYNTYPTPAVKDQINIGLWHQDIASKSIVQDMYNTFGLDIFEKDPVVFDDESGEFYGYDYNFFGHLHSIFGIYRLGEKTRGSWLYYLGSLVRTKENEVNDRFLKRDIPAIIVENGKFQRIEHNFFELPNRSSTVVESKVEANRLKYEAKKREKELRKFSSIKRDPLEAVKDACSLDPYTSEILQGFLKSGHNEIEQDLILRLIKQGVWDG